MPMLNGTLTLHGVDAEKLATAVANDWCRQQRLKGSDLTDSRKEDLIAYLLGEAWRVSLAYDPAKSPRFYNYARSLLALRCTDWLRKDEGRTRWQFAGHTYERERPKVTSLDTNFGDGLRFDNSTGENSDRYTNGWALADPASGDVTDSVTALEWLEDHGDRTRDRDHDLIRAAATRRAA